MKRREEILHRINLIKLFVEAAVTILRSYLLITKC